MRDIYRDMAERTGGDIYIAVAGPVRTGKSTFIKRFSELLLLPNMENEYEKDRLTDELPQSGAGRSIMTTQPRFVPAEAVTRKLRSIQAQTSSSGTLPSSRMETQLLWFM